MTPEEIRKQFLDFFRSKGHTIVESSPVVPPSDDPSLKDTFTNAGMNQFKDVFLGTGSRPYNRAANTQKCIRAGGKHNDLDDVGKDTYHHTFFEMLGNWSFGNYFKKEAIEWAWELLTEVWKIDKRRLHATYFEGDESEGLEPDHEVAELWRTVTDIDPSHVHPGNKKDNFWEMGDTGPCGPCSEIHIDLTPDMSGASLVNAGDARVIELWNLVFIQFNRATGGKLSPLSAKHVDTGMGFERLCAVLVGMRRGKLGGTSNYDTDVFTPIFDAIQKRTGAPKYTGTLPGDEDNGMSHEQVMIDVSYRVIADHARCLTFALTDGATPSNESRGYVLRRILRRAARYGRQYMNMHEPFLCDLVAPVVELMGDAFPELRSTHGGKNVEHVTELIRDEEESFLKTLDRGLVMFDKVVSEIEFLGTLSSRARSSPNAIPLKYEIKGLGQDSVELMAQRIIPGIVAFRLHDTYGFPIDLTKVMADEEGLTIDIVEYERLMAQARDRSITFGAKAFIAAPVDLEQLGIGLTTEFVGYERAEIDRTAVTAILRGETIQPRLVAGDAGEVVLARTPFYPEQGGQVGDRGKLMAVNGEWEFEVTTSKKCGMYILHYGECRKGEMSSYLSEEACKGQQLLRAGRLSKEFPRLWAGAIVDRDSRSRTSKNHTATHMLNWALRVVLGDHVQQKGSLVDPEKTRFDFSHNRPLGDDELARIEDLVNERIAAKLRVFAASQEKDFIEEKKARAINTLRAVFGEKYPPNVRVVSIGAPVTKEDAEKEGESDWLLKNPTDAKWMDYSVEFCGGTHVKNTSDIKSFVLISEEGVAKGVRRLVGISGDAAENAVTLGAELLTEAQAMEKPCQQSPDRDSKQSRDREGAELSKNQSGEREGADLAGILADFQQRLGDAEIPISVRNEIRVILAEVQKRAKQQQRQAASESGEVVRDAVAKLLGDAETVNGVTIVVGEVPSANADALRGAVDWVRNKTEASAVLLATVSDGRVTLIAGMSKAVVGRGVKAGDLIREIAPLVGGKGGGRPDMAQGGGSDADGITKALESGETWINARVS